MGGLWGKVEGDARVILALGNVAGDEETLPCGLEGPVEGSEEGQRAIGENLGLCLRGEFRENVDACRHSEAARWEDTNVEFKYPPWRDSVSPSDLRSDVIPMGEANWRVKKDS